MPRDPLLRAWTALLGLSLATTAVALTVEAGALTGGAALLAGALLLALAWAKARVILARYLGLAEAPFWARGFGIVLGLYALLLLGLYMAGGVAG